jgi:hypothetical protein
MLVCAKTKVLAASVSYLLHYGSHDVDVESKEIVQILRNEPSLDGVCRLSIEPKQLSGNVPVSGLSRRHRLSGIFSGMTFSIMDLKQICATSRD